MAQFILKVNGAKADLSAEEEIQKKLEWIQQSVLDVSGNLSFKVASTAGIKKNLTTLASRVEWHKNGMSSMRNALGSAINLYEKTEKDVCGYAAGKAVKVSEASDVDKVGAAISPGKGWAAGVSLGSMTLSVTESDVANLLSSKVGKAIISYGRSKSKWVDRLCDTASSNYEEYKSGEISGARAVVETFMETAIEAGKGKLVNGLVKAAFTAICVTNPPGIVVTAAATVVTWGLDWVSEKLTGKKVTEAVSDFLIDTGEKVVKNVGKAVTTAKKKIGAAWKSITSKWPFK